MDTSPEMKKATQMGMNRFVFVVIALALGGCVGTIIWLFFKLMDIGLELLWTIMPSNSNSTYYPLVICIIGGLVIGLSQKYIGQYPQELKDVMAQVKSTGRYDYKKTPGVTLCAFLPLVFGGSVGPEAGLTGVIAGLCTWVGDRFKNVAAEMKELANIGMSATLGVIFHAPLFGYVAPIEDDGEGVTIPQKAKTVLYFAAIFGGAGSYYLLVQWFGGGMGIGHFGQAVVGQKEVLWFVPLALMGVAAGYLYYISGKLLEKVMKPLKDRVVTSAVIGGVLLGLSGVYLPFTMFAGETQMGVVMADWRVMPAALLLLTGLVKIVITNVCLKTGWRGGNIFPVIFSGICLGYCMAHVAGIDGVFAVAVVTSALCGVIMRKPVAVIVLLLLCFPVKGVISLSVAAFVGAYAPIPNVLKPEH